MQPSPLAASYADISHAARVLDGIAHRTPVLTSRQANTQTGAQIYFKCENFQRMGAFKFRGAYYAISQLNAQQKQRGVIAFSSGNHAQAVALAAQLQGVKATIVMPHDAPAIKLAATRGYGAEVVIYQRGVENRELIARTLAADRGCALIPPFDHAHVIAGQGTAADELLREVGALDTLLVCLGGGGLLSGSALAAAELAPHCQVIGVEPEAGNDVQQSWRTGQIVEIAVPDTIADGARTSRVGDLTWPILQAYVADILTVSDAQLRAQMRFFAERMKMVVEPTGCLAAAAAFDAGLDLRGQRVGVIVSGGNVDLQVLSCCLRDEY